MKKNLISSRSLLICDEYIIMSSTSNLSHESFERSKSVGCSMSESDDIPADSTDFSITQE